MLLRVVGHLPPEGRMPQTRAAGVRQASGEETAGPSWRPQHRPAHARGPGAEPQRPPDARLPHRRADRSAPPRRPRRPPPAWPQPRPLRWAWGRSLKFSLDRRRGGPMWPPALGKGHAEAGRPRGGAHTREPDRQGDLRWAWGSSPGFFSPPGTRRRNDGARRARDPSRGPFLCVLCVEILLRWAWTPSLISRSPAIIGDRRVRFSCVRFSLT